MFLLVIAGPPHTSKCSQPGAGGVFPKVQISQMLLTPTDDWEGGLEAWDFGQAWSTLHIWDRT